MPRTPADQSIPAPAACRGGGVSPPLDRRGAKRRLDRNYGNQEARMPPAARSLAVAAAVGVTPTALLALTFLPLRGLAPLARSTIAARLFILNLAKRRATSAVEDHKVVWRKSQRDTQVAQRVLVQRLKYALCAGYVPKKLIEGKAVLRFGPLPLELGGGGTCPRDA